MDHGVAPLANNVKEKDEDFTSFLMKKRHMLRAVPKGQDYQQHNFNANTSG
eukprot:c3567_g1_i1 orf=2-151(-)